MDYSSWYDSWATTAPTTAAEARVWFRGFAEATNALRRPGVAEGLRPVESLVDRRVAWEDGPTPRVAKLSPEWYRGSESATLADSTEVFIDNLNREYPELRIPKGKLWPPAARGLVIAGGAAGAAVRHSWRASAGDVDFFLVGHANDAERRVAIISLADWLGQGGPIHAHSTPGAITFLVNGREYQVVLRGYTTAAEVLHGFDLGSSSALFDGHQAMVNEVGAFAFETGYNFVTLAGYRPSYENRLAKYFDRGYGLVLPELDPFKALVAGRLRSLKFVGLRPAGGPDSLHVLAAETVESLGGFAAGDEFYSNFTASCALIPEMTARHFRACGLEIPYKGTLCMPDFDPSILTRGAPVLDSGTGRALGLGGEVVRPVVFRGVGDDTLLAPEAERPEALRRWYGAAHCEA